MEHFLSMSNLCNLSILPFVFGADACLCGGVLRVDNRPVWAWTLPRGLCNQGVNTLNKPPM